MDVDDEVLTAARANTVNESLRRGGTARSAKVKQALDRLAGIEFQREEAWR